MMGRVLRSSFAAAGLLLLLVAPAEAQDQPEVIGSYEVQIRILADGDLEVTERIEYSFGSQRRHGILRTIPTRFPYDDVFDRIFPIEDVSVESATAPTDVELSEEGGITTIRVGDPDVEISGLHTYVLTYRVAGALNAFPDHDELYWNAIGDEWPVPIERVSVAVSVPESIERVGCFQGYEGSTEPCAQAEGEGSRASFRPGRELSAFEGLTVVVAIPKGAVPDPEPILEERWSAGRAFSVNPGTATASVAVLALLGGALFRMWSREGRDRRFRGSQIDQVMGSPTGEDEAVPFGEGDAEAPVEFAPPEDVRPGQIGTLIDERANVIDVTATIVDLAGRGFLLIQEIPDRGFFSKTDWNLIRLEKAETGLLAYERQLLDGLFRDGNEVKVLELKTTFAARLHDVEESLYKDAMQKKWFRARPDQVRTRWAGRGALLAVAGGVVTFILARWTHWGLVGIPVIVAGIALALTARRMPARTAKGTAILRRIRGFRRVIATAETHMSRWAEEENVFTRYLPYAIVFGLTKKWAKAFEDLGIQPDTSGWYVAPHVFTAVAFANSIDGFAVTTGGTLASTPASSGSSGFGGGGSSGGGGGGGGGGSW
ncbi:MAG: DUF2207 domain-containing protein [Actinobacteria bacterium]|nr:DUF2207 domain-containing protein [Actinomycetota bacterium]